MMRTFPKSFSEMIRRRNSVTLGLLMLSSRENVLRLIAVRGKGSLHSYQYRKTSIHESAKMCHGASF